MDRDWTASFSIRFRNGTCIIILDKKYDIANSSCHLGSYSFGPYNIFLVTDRSIYCHMILSAMNYLLYNTFFILTHWFSSFFFLCVCVYCLLLFLCYLFFVLILVVFFIFCFFCFCFCLFVCLFFFV
jgi:hypothetical protein